MRKRLTCRPALGWTLLMCLTALGCGSASTSEPAAVSTTATPVPEASPESADVGAAVPQIAETPVAGYLADEAALVRGRGVFRAACTGYCHTTSSADRVAPNLFDCGWIHGASDQEIYRTIYDGVPETEMLGFGEKVPDEDLWKIVAFLRKQSKCG